MNLDFTEEQDMLRTMAKDFLQKECPKTLVRELEESDQGYSPDIWKKMAELGWLGLIFPEKYGGGDGGFLDLMVIMEEIGRNILPSPFLSTVVLGGLPILANGTEEQKQEYLSKISNGEMIATLALTEPSGTLKATSVTLKATADGDSYVLDGTKLFVSDANIANMMLVVTRTQPGTTPEQGITVFMVDAKSPGISCSVIPTIGMENLCEVVFEKVKVPKANILGQLDQGWSIVEQIMVQAALAKCMEMIGGAQAALDMAHTYSQERIQYKKPIGSFQVIQFYLANMWMDVEASRNISYEAAWRVAEGLPEGRKMTAAAKAYANEAYKRISERGVQIHGGIGITRDHDMGLYYRRAKAADVAFGDTDYWQDVMAKEIGM